MDRLPRHLWLRIVRQVVKRAASPRDQMRLLRIPPGRLSLPPVLAPAPAMWSHRCVTRTVPLPGCKQYTVHKHSYTSEDAWLWQTCMLCIVPGHPDLPPGTAWKELASWTAFRPNGSWASTMVRSCQ